MVKKETYFRFNRLINKVSFLKAVNPNLQPFFYANNYLGVTTRVGLFVTSPRFVPRCGLSTTIPNARQSAVGSIQSAISKHIYKALKNISFFSKTTSSKTIIQAHKNEIFRYFCNLNFNYRADCIKQADN